jgi:hypothetical protein
MKWAAGAILVLIAGLCVWMYRAGTSDDWGMFIVAVISVIVFAVLPVYLGAKSRGADTARVARTDGIVIKSYPPSQNGEPAGPAGSDQ